MASRKSGPVIDPLINQISKVNSILVALGIAARCWYPNRRDLADMDVTWLESGQACRRVGPSESYWSQCRDRIATFVWRSGRVRMWQVLSESAAVVTIVWVHVIIRRFKDKTRNVYIGTKLLQNAILPCRYQQTNGHRSRCPRGGGQVGDWRTRGCSESDTDANLNDGRSPTILPGWVGLD